MLFDAHEGANKRPPRILDTTLWIPTRLVIATMHLTWGDFQGHRQFMLREIAQELADATDLDAFTTELFSDEIHLAHTLAWAGTHWSESGHGSGTV